jgi:hypothetical protein
MSETETQTTPASAPAPAPAPASPPADKLDIQALLADQNFPLAAAAGITAGFVSALAWAALTVATDTIWGVMAVVVGAVVGYAVRTAGHGIENRFGVLAVVCALGGCLLGSFFSTEAYLAKYHHHEIVDYIMSRDPSQFASDYLRGFQGMDILFYVIAAAQAYRSAFKFRLVKKPAPVK